MSRALLSLTPAESKLLIGRAVAQDPAVGRALERGPFFRCDLAAPH